MKTTTLLTLLFGFIFSMNAQLDYYDFAADNNSGYPQVSSSATLLYTTGDDDETTNVPLGFDFYYRGTMYNTCTVGVNGAISFTEDQIYASNLLAATTIGHINMIAPLWDDLKLFASNNGYIKYETTGTAPNRIFTVSWYNISRYGDEPNDMSFLLQLHETSNQIVFFYGHHDTAGTLNASIGLNANDFANTSFYSVTPGSPATTSTSTANDNIAGSDFPDHKHYTFSFNHAYNDFNSQASPIILAAPRDTTHPLYAFNNVGATNSGGYVPTCANFQGGDVWYQFVAPTTGAINLIRTTAGDIGSLGFAIYHNTYNSAVEFCDYLGESTSSLGKRYLIKDLTAGDTYYIRMWDYGNNDFGTTSFYAETIEPNDEADNALDIGVQPDNASMFILTTANNTYTTGSEDTNGTPSCGGYSGGDLWYKFTVPSSGEIKVAHADAAGDWSSFGFAVYDSPTANTPVDCDVIYISGHTAPYTTSVISGLTVGNDYYIRVWDFNNNDAGSSKFYLTDNNATDVEEYESLSFKYYPNPATDVLNVNAQNNVDVITLTNLLGQEVLKAQPAHTQTSLNISSLKQGVYLMKVKIGDKVSTVKIVKK